MRGRRNPQITMLAFIDLEERVPPDHPLRTIKRLADEALAELSPTFDEMYAEDGRPSIPPERLLKASLLIALYSVRSERAFCEELDYNLLFRWFLDMDLIEPSFDPTVVHQEPRAAAEARGRAAALRRGGRPGPRAGAALGRALHRRRDADRGGRQPEELQAEGRRAADDHRRRSGQPVGRLPRREALERDPPEHDRPRSPAVQEGQGQGSEALLHGPRADGEPPRAAGRLPGDRTPPGRPSGTWSRSCSTRPRSARFHPKTLGGDKDYDTRDCVADMRERRVTPHVAQNTSNRRSAIDGRTTRHPGYAVSQRIRKRVEEIFGWMKTVGGFRRTRYRGLDRTGLAGYLVATAYNLVRLSRLALRRAETPAAA